ncbi:MAG: sugar ABC transporter substrate-binding protein [Bacteroidota bacterium]
MNSPAGLTSWKGLAVGGAIALGAIALRIFLTGDEASQHLVFSTWGTPEEVETFRQLIDRYNSERHPTHSVVLAHSEQYQYTERLLVRAAAHSLPDVIHLDRKDLPLYTRKGLLEDLTLYIREDTSVTPDDFLPELIASCTVGGRYYALPHNFSTLVLYYNRDHFDAEGIPYPDTTWTWETLVNVSRRLTRTGAAGETIRFGCLMQIAFPILIYQNGGSILNAPLDSCVIASPEGVGSFQFAVDLSERHHVSWSMLAQNMQWDDMVVGGRLSMIATGRWAAPVYFRAMGPGVMDIAPLPRGKLRRGGATVHVMGIAAESDKKAEAWEFVKYLVSEEGQRLANKDGVSISARRSVAMSDEFLRHPAFPGLNSRVFLDELPASVVWPYEQGPYVSTYTLQSQLERAMRRVLLGEATVRESLLKMEEEVNNVIRASRQSAVPVPFVGSAVFYLCAASLIGVAGVAWVYGSRRRQRGVRINPIAPPPLP